VLWDELSNGKLKLDAAFAEDSAVEELTLLRATYQHRTDFLGWLSVAGSSQYRKT